MPLNGLIDIRQTPEYAAYMQKIGWQIRTCHLRGVDLDSSEMKISGFLYFIKKLPLLPFSFIKIHRPAVDISLSAVRQLAHKHHALWIRISPSGNTIYAHNTNHAKT